MNNKLNVRHCMRMKHIILSLALIGLSVPAQAACFADYKAKQDNPLRLHYGVVQLNGSCDVQSAQSEIAGRLTGGWQLLNVVSVFNDDQLPQKQESAGDYFLRF